MMSRVCMLAVVLVCAVVAVTAEERLVPVEVAHLDANDRLVGTSMRMVTESLFSLSAASAAKVESGTPKALSEAIAKSFPVGSPTIHWKFPQFTRPASLKPWCGCNVQVTYNVHDRQPLPVHHPCDLHDGNFTFVFTADNQVTFGSPKDVLEWGTKHVHMANMRPGFGAGEITVHRDPNNSTARVIRWNLKSGCFSRLLVEQNDATFPTRLQEAVSNVWKSTECGADFAFQREPLLTEGPPFVDEVVEICKHVGRKHFNHLAWTSCSRGLAKYLENETLCMDYWHLPKCLPFQADETKTNLLSLAAASPSLAAVDAVTEGSFVDAAPASSPVAAVAPAAAAASVTHNPALRVVGLLCLTALALTFIGLFAVSRMRKTEGVVEIADSSERVYLNDSE